MVGLVSSLFWVDIWFVWMVAWFRSLGLRIGGFFCVAGEWFVCLLGVNIMVSRKIYHSWFWGYPMRVFTVFPGTQYSSATAFFCCVGWLVAGGSDLLEHTSIKHRASPRPRNAILRL